MNYRLRPLALVALGGATVAGLTAGLMERHVDAGEIGDALVILAFGLLVVAAVVGVIAIVRGGDRRQGVGSQPCRRPAVLARSASRTGHASSADLMDPTFGRQQARRFAFLAIVAGAGAWVEVQSIPRDWHQATLLAGAALVAALAWCERAVAAGMGGGG